MMRERKKGLNIRRSRTTYPAIQSTAFGSGMDGVMAAVTAVFAVDFGGIAPDRDALLTYKSESESSSLELESSGTRSGISAYRSAGGGTISTGNAVVRAYIPSSARQTSCMQRSVGWTRQFLLLLHVG